MPFRYQKWISRQDLKDNPKSIYVFGDNLLQRGLGGQAKFMRGEPNAFGIPTKKAPSDAESDFFSDSDYDQIAPTIEGFFDRLEVKAREGVEIVWPQDGIGTGLADLPTRAPKLWAYFQMRLRKLIEIAT